MNDTARGALAMMLATATFNFNDVMMKLILADLPLGQAIFLRSSLSVLVGFVMLGIAAGYGNLRDLFHPAVLLRTAIITATVVCFLSALPHLSIAVLTSLLQVTPLITTALAAIFLGEKVGWRRWTATGVGLIGVLIIIDPFSGSGVVGTFALLGLAVAALNALRDLTVRAAPVSTPTMIIALAATIGGALLGVAISAGQSYYGTPWKPVSPQQWGLVSVAAVCSMAGHYFVSRAMRLGEMSVVSPFRYSVVLWAMLWSWVIFADPPPSRVLLGAAIVIGAGLYLMWRERIVGARPSAASSAPSAR